MVKDKSNAAAPTTVTAADRSLRIRWRTMDSYILGRLM
jgi:hypothetical protein